MKYRHWIIELKNKTSLHLWMLYTIASKAQFLNQSWIPTAYSLNSDELWHNLVINKQYTVGSRILYFSRRWFLLLNFNMMQSTQAGVWKNHQEFPCANLGGTSVILFSEAVVWTILLGIHYFFLIQNSCGNI